MFENVLSAIEELEIYATNQVRIWNEARQRAEYGSDDYMRATAKWQAYLDMAEKLADLGEMAEREALKCTNGAKG